MISVNCKPALGSKRLLSALLLCGAPLHTLQASQTYSREYTSCACAFCRGRRPAAGVRWVGGGIATSAAPGTRCCPRLAVRHVARSCGFVSILACSLMVCRRKSRYCQSRSIATSHTRVSPTAGGPALQERRQKMLTSLS
jgi:hypothetical protein